MRSATTGFGYLDDVPSGAVLAFAHRGGAHHPDLTGVENSLRAFRHAADLGYRYLETDVHLTRDGVLVAFHDESLDRVTDRTGPVAGLTLAEVQQARINGAEPVPTLAELVAAFPGLRFNIDIKSAAAVAPLARFVAEHDLWDRVCVGSFSVRRTRRFRRLTAGRVPTAAHLGEILALRLVPSARLARIVGGRGRALQVPHRRGRFRVVTAGLVRRAHATGRQVHVWTVDSPEEMHELLDRGVDGLFTDRTDVLKDVLLERDQWWSG
ncbi:glycerophosphodiester phosphodiesterase [Nocardioides panacisoli]|uniref:glycerophosphodiester phosphodiesterase n=1 Tax=Nocardioides panacisoli TaxID=627624 RepID=UPI001C62F036|nr:glycerophosphodiester phosphodiesterase [Nocardioides panacisoli]QYJ05071.1 glycerophosphodiester phosphodiesterase [Nocardioides panacisoli]